MIYGVYVIRDLKSTFMTPTVDYNDSTAIRNFKHACKNTDSLFYAVPSDFQLFRIGNYDNEQGIIVPFSVPELVCSGEDVAD